MNPTLSTREVDIRDAGEAARIDDFVRATPGATPFHLTGWSRAVERGCGQRARYLIAEDVTGAIVGVLPLTEMRSRLFGRALASVGFAVGGGVLGDGVKPLAAAAWALAGRLGCPGVELRGGAVPDGWQIDDHSYVGFSRDLAPDDATELKATPRRKRAELRRAAALDVETRPGDLDIHYALFAESVRNLGTPVFPRALFAAVLDELDADILVTSYEGRVLSSVLSIYFNGTAYPYWSGKKPESREWRTDEHLHFRLMRHAFDRGCTRIDFGRSKVGTGAATYKHNWGFEPEPLVYATRSVGEPRVINPLNPKYVAMVAAWKKLPLPVANLIGPWISRGLG